MQYIHHKHPHQEISSMSQHHSTFFASYTCSARPDSSPSLVDISKTHIAKQLVIFGSTLY